MNTYDYGDDVQLEATITDPAGTPTNPSTIACKVKAPDGTISTPTVSSGGTGIRLATITLNQEGEWSYRFEATGPNVAVESRLLVRNSAFY